MAHGSSRSVQCYKVLMWLCLCVLYMGCDSQTRIGNLEHGDKVRLCYDLKPINSKLIFERNDGHMSVIGYRNRHCAACTELSASCAYCKYKWIQWMFSSLFFCCCCYFSTTSAFVFLNRLHLSLHIKSNIKYRFFFNFCLQFRISSFFVCR